MTESRATPRRAATDLHTLPGLESQQQRLSDELERWLRSDQDTSLRSLIAVFGDSSFAILFVLLLGVSALPLPTGGLTHVFGIIAVLLALQLIAGREQIWLPKRRRDLQLAGAKQERFINGLMKIIRWLERYSRPRLRFLFNHRFSNIAFGARVVGGAVASFLAPPFSGLDTLPSLGVVVLPLGVVLEDALVVAVALVIGVVGVVLEIVLGAAAIKGISSLL